MSTKGHQHHSHESTRKLNYDRLRDQGVPHDAARKTADEAATIAHKKLDKEG